MKSCFKLLLTVALLGIPSVLRADSTNLILAVVGNKVITLQQVESQFAEFRPIPETNAAGRWRSIYEARLNDNVVLQEFKRLEKEKGMKIPENFIDDIMRERIRAVGGDRAEYSRILRARGTTMEQDRNDVRDRFIVDQLHILFAPEPIISPAKIEAYYKEHQADYSLAERVKYRWIARNKPETPRPMMDEILSLARGSNDFGSLADSYSQAQQRDKEWQSMDAMNETFRSELAKLKPGESSGVIEISDRYYILRLDERDAPHVRSLHDDEVRNDIERILKGVQRNQRIDNWHKRIESKTFIQRFY